MGFEGDPRDLLAGARSATAAARSARPRVWIPIAILGAVVALAMPLYKQWPLTEWGQHGQRSDLLLGYSQLQHPAPAAWYWVIALPVAYAAIAVYLLGRGLARGIRVNVSGIVATGSLLTLGVFSVTMLAPAAVQQYVPGNLLLRGLLPLIVIGVAIIVWGLVLPRISVIVVGAAALAASLTSNLYNLENPLLAAGIEVPFEYRLTLNVGFTAVVLLAGAAVVAWTERR